MDRWSDTARQDTGAARWSIALLAIGTLTICGSASAATIPVNCAQQPNALSTALTAAMPGDTLRLEGTCVGTYTIAKSLRLTGKGNAAIDGNGSGPVLTITAGVDVVLESLIIKGGVATAAVAVGGISNSGHLTLDRSAVIGNTARGESLATGGIASGPGTTATLSMDRTEVSGNRATVTSAGSGSAAGGVRTEGPVTLSRTDIVDNMAFASTGSVNRAFGGILVGPGPGYIDKSAISRNTAHAEHTGSTGTGLVAGAIGGLTHAPSPDPLVIEKTVIADNAAFAVSPVGSGAAGGLNTRTTTLINSEVVDNIAEAGTLAVAGIANHNATLVLEKTTVERNVASATEANGLAGAGIVTGYLTIAQTRLTKSTVTKNVASGADAVGGLYQVPVNGSYVLTKSDVDHNQPVDCNFACQ